jgi:hypothetical protein
MFDDDDNNKSKPFECIQPPLFFSLFFLAYCTSIPIVKKESRHFLVFQPQKSKISSKIDNSD